MEPKTPALQGQDLVALDPASRSTMLELLRQFNDSRAVFAQKSQVAQEYLVFLKTKLKLEGEGWALTQDAGAFVKNAGLPAKPLIQVQPIKADEATAKLPAEAEAKLPPEA